ncbi:phage tail terminator-like protein [Sulfitobacter pacificus]|uniref:phage tail terminator-like protein n=1 Tax=Sulfitobacter pacificus TaxID=1499314 RepID=UPI00310939CF
MIDENDIAQALGQRLQTLADVPYIVWGNKDAPEGLARPYLRFQLVPVGSGGKISGGKVQTGFAQVLVVADLDEFETPANTLAENIAALFPYEQTLTCGDGVLTVTTHTIPKGGFRDGSDWLKPVQIDWIAV